jgi:hypothetical protein
MGDGMLEVFPLPSKEWWQKQIHLESKAFRPVVFSDGGTVVQSKNDRLEACPTKVVQPPAFSGPWDRLPACHFRNV